MTDRELVEDLLHAFIMNLRMWSPPFEQATTVLIEEAKEYFWKQSLKKATTATFKRGVTLKIKDFTPAEKDWFIALLLDLIAHPENTTLQFEITEALKRRITRPLEVPETAPPLE